MKETTAAENLRAGASRKRCQDWDLSSTLASAGGTPAEAHGMLAALADSTLTQGAGVAGALDLTAGALKACLSAAKRWKEVCHDGQGPGVGDGTAQTEGTVSAALEPRASSAAPHAGAFGHPGSVHKKLHPLVARRLAARAAQKEAEEVSATEASSGCYGGGAGESPDAPGAGPRVLHLSTPGPLSSEPSSTLVPVILRLAALRLGDPVALLSRPPWGDWGGGRGLALNTPGSSSSAGQQDSLLRFLASLRGALQGSRAVAVVSVNSDAVSDAEIDAAVHLSTAALRIRGTCDDSDLVSKARAGSLWVPVGTCEVLKTPALGGLSRDPPPKAPFVLQLSRTSMRIAEVNDVIDAV